MTGETEHAERQLVVLGKHALPARRGRDPRWKQLGQQAQVLGRPGHRGPGAGQDHRSVSGPQRLGRGLHHPVIGAPRLAAIGRGLEPVVAGRLPPDLDRHVEVDRPGTPREREAHGAAQVVREALRRGHHGRVLGDRAEHRHDVDVLAPGLLRRSPAEGVRGRLSGQHQHRYAVGERARHAGEQVGRARSAGGRAHRDPVPGPGEPVRHEGRALLVPAHDQAELLGVLHRVEERIQEAARDPEHHRHTLGLHEREKGVDGGPRARHVELPGWHEPNRSNPGAARPAWISRSCPRLSRPVGGTVS